MNYFKGYVKDKNQPKITVGVFLVEDNKIVDSFCSFELKWESEFEGLLMCELSMISPQFSSFLHYKDFFLTLSGLENPQEYDIIRILENDGVRNISNINPNGFIL